MEIDLFGLKLGKEGQNNGQFKKKEVFEIYEDELINALGFRKDQIDSVKYYENKKCLVIITRA